MSHPSSAAAVAQFQPLAASSGGVVARAGADFFRLPVGRKLLAMSMRDISQLSQSVQDQICSSSQFSQRTDALAAVLQCRLSDLARKMGVSERSLFGYRSGRYPVTAKALRKLAAAEIAAGTNLKDVRDFGRSVVSDAFPDYQAVPKREIFPREDPLAAINRQMADLQSQVAALNAPFLMSALRDLMAAHSAWPPVGEDLDLTPAQLFAKYAAR